MCDKLPYCNRKIDDCLLTTVKRINKSKNIRTLASCCGHGKYKPTIVIIVNNKDVYEFFTKTKLDRKKRNRYYKTDVDKYYYIPELLKPILEPEIRDFCYFGNSYNSDCKENCFICSIGVDLIIRIKENRYCIK